MVDLHQFNRRAVHLDEGNHHPGAGTGRLDDHVMTIECVAQIIDLERNVRHVLDQIGIWRVMPVSRPLETEWVVQMIADVTFRYGSGIAPSNELTVGIPRRLNSLPASIVRDSPSRS